jgi:hypothetical protein
MTIIVLDIEDMAGPSHYEVLCLSPADWKELDDKEKTRKVTDIASRLKRGIQRKAVAGDEEAAVALERVNGALSVLKNKEAREKYDEELRQGKGATLEVLKVEKVAPTFFWDRRTRLRAVGQALKDRGWTQDLGDQIDDAAGPSHYEVLGLSPTDLDGLDDTEKTRKVTDVASRLKRPIQRKAQAGDEEATAALNRINSALSVLKNKWARDKYDDELRKGKGAAPVEEERLTQALGDENLPPQTFEEGNE